MTQFEKDQISRAFLAKLYESLTAQPDVEAEALPEDRFIAWCQPGLPFEPDDFLFAVRGIGGSAGGEEDEGSEGTESEGDRFKKSVLRRGMAAAEWSHLVNFVPNPNGIYDAEQQKRMFDTTTFTQDGSSVASIYRNVLEFSEVASVEPTEEQQKQVDRARGLLTATRTETDLVTGEEKQVTDDSPLVKAYDQFASEYYNARSEYTNKRLSGLDPENDLGSQDWMLNSELYRNKLRSAYHKWVSAGHKHDVEDLRALIDQVSQRSLRLLKDDLLDDLDKAELGNPGTGGESFYWTSLIPSSLPFAEGWSTYNFQQSDTKIHKDKETNEWSGDADIPAFGWSFSPKTSGSTESYEEEVDTSNFSMTYEMAQGMISRPWMDTTFLLSNAWRFRPDMPNLTNLTQTLSNGKKPPEWTGSLIAYPTTAIFVRNVTVNFDELQKEDSTFKRDIDAKLGVSIGPVRIGGGKYKRGDETRDFESHVGKQGLKVPGMQLIGFKCKLLPELPSPSPEVPTEAWS